MKIRPILIFLCCLFILSYGYAQEELAVKETKKKEKERLKMPPKSDYLRISVSRDTTALDTLLTFEKGLRHNVANRDLFAFLPFANPGRPMNALTRELPFSRPSLGVPMQHYMLYEKEQMHFYRNPTPISEFFFLTILNRGQNLDSNLAFNLTDQFNMSLGFRGFRSEGHYVGEETNSTSFRTTFNYTSENKLYQLRGFMTTHNMNQLEPGALKFIEAQFESGNPQFLERRYVDQLITNADSRVLQRAYYFDQRYKLVGALEITQSFHYDSRAYVFNQSSADELFGELAEGTAVGDKHAMRYSDLSAGLSFLGRSWGTLSASIRQLSTRQEFDNLLLNGESVATSISEEAAEPMDAQMAYAYADTQLRGVYSNVLGRVALDAEVNLPVQSTLQGFSLSAHASLGLGEGRFLRGWFDQNNKLPALNFLRYQSNYSAFQWDNFDQATLESHTQLRVELSDRRLGTLSAQLKTLNSGYFFEAPYQSYTAFGDDFVSLQPTRLDALVTERSITYSNAIKWRKLTLDLKGLYQQSDDSSGLYNIPKFVARSALFVSTDLFEKAMFAHIGVKARYFDTYFADGYHPVLGVFYSQQHTSLPGYAVIDAFVFAKVRSMDIFLTYEHLNADWALPGYFAAPGIPFRDSVLRFGFTWNFLD
ncbi:MAG: hypothetical protein O3C00_00260 [Bacteroidetes bacterium]|nr:hypothetical protein [Bacteroidota bacterium]MDA0950474.1 hypothetical protein [Bacteroidota bacterium]